MVLKLSIGLSRQGWQWLNVSDATGCHLLVAGITGSGKSSFLRQLVIKACMDYSPDQLHFYGIDHKKAELSLFRNVSHWQQVSHSLDTTVSLLQNINNLLDDRAALLEKHQVLNLLDCPALQPWVLVVIDELSEFAAAREPDKSLRAAKYEVHALLDRITRLGRALQVHAILCTQRPDKDSLPGYIKANIPATVAFKVRNAINSIMLLDSGDAAQLPGLPGRALYQAGLKQVEVQTLFIDENETRELLRPYMVDSRPPAASAATRKGVL